MKADIKWLDDPEIFRVNQRAAHSDHICYASKSERLENRNSLRQSLNGQWKFCFSKNPMERPVNFYEAGYDAKDFDSIQVPAHIEIAGFDQIQYVNTIYPWEGHEFLRPAHTLSADNTGAGVFSEMEYNPVGSYLTEFTLDAGLQGKAISLCFEGVEQVVYVWLNGHFVGYGTDTFTPSEFDLTPFLKEKNTLAIEVYKRSVANYLEDQDFFRFFGIFRDVYLMARPKNHLEDMWMKPSLLEDNTTGVFAVDLKFEDVTGDGMARMRICNSKEEVLWEETLVISEELHITGKTFASVSPWSNRKPVLYTFELEMLDATGAPTAYVAYPFGFRRIEIKNKRMLLNGERLIINGTNRHEWNAGSGRVISQKDMQTDMEIIQRNHINSVRTSHYPNQIPWYYMSDQKGIYLMAECNLESHGTWMAMGDLKPSYNVPGAVPQWLEVVIDRARTNFMTFRNHTSVLFWSLGNESYAEENIRQMNVFYKENDPDRLVHYEGNFWNPAFEDSISDLKSRMYATPQEIVDYLENDPQKPYILCEYMHDMGNSMGGLNTYMALLDQYEMYQGGYIWDFIDQALFVKDEVTGQEVLRYGGDFDDRPADYEFSGNGIVFADRTEKPAMQEVKYYYGKYSK
ncbi:MAG: beta-galactosidase [Lachnospiraceae bacterium]|nr:beta-galactosidase [Lachnospiraceae bacterium]